MTTLNESSENMRLALQKLGVAIGDTVTYPIITARINILHKNTKMLPPFSWELYTNHREIYRLVKMKTDIDNRRATHESK